MTNATFNIKCSQIIQMKKERAAIDEKIQLIEKQIEYHMGKNNHVTSGKFEAEIISFKRRFFNRAKFIKKFGDAAFKSVSENSMTKYLKVSEL